MPQFAPVAPTITQTIAAPSIPSLNVEPIQDVNTHIADRPVTNELSFADRVALANQTAYKNLASTPVAQNEKMWTPYATPLAQTMRYNDPNIGFNAFDSGLEYKYADEHWAQNIGNNILKLGANVIGALGSSIMTIPSAIAAVNKGDLSTFFDNDVTNGISEWTEGLETSLPTYTSKYRDEHPFVSAFNPFHPIEFANTWSEVLKNLGYTIGSVAGAVAQDFVVGVATGGSGDVALIPMQIGKAAKWLGTLGKTARALGTSVEVAENAVTALSTVNRIGNAARYGLSLGTSAISEASIESNQTFRQTKDLLSDEYRKRYGSDPDMKEQAKIHDMAINAGNANLIANSVLLSVTNGISLGGFLGSKVISKEAALIAKAGKKLVRNEAGELVAQALTKGEIWGSRLSKLASPLSETFEEGSQYFSDKAIQSYALRKYDNPDDIHALGDALAEGAKETFLSQEGQYSMFMGFLTGGLIETVGGRLKRSLGFEPSQNEINQTANYYEAILKNSPLTGLLQSNYNAAVEQGAIAKDTQSSIETGSDRERRNSEHQRLHSYVYAGIKAGRADQQIEEIGMLKEFDDNQIEKYSDGKFNAKNRQEFSQHVDNMIRDAKEIRSAIENVDAAFVNPYSRETQMNKFQAYEDYKQQLSYLISMSSDTKRRIGNLSTEVQEKLGGAIDVQRASKLFSVRGLRETIQNFENRLKELDTLELTPTQVQTNVANTDAVNEGLKNSYRRERSFLKDKIETLRNRSNYYQNRVNLENISEDTTISDIETNAASYERYLNDTSDILNYFSEGENGVPQNTDRFGGILNRMDIAQSLEDIYTLDKQERDAFKLYKALATKKGLGAFNRYRNSYISDNKVLITDENGNQSFITVEERNVLTKKAAEEAFANSPMAEALFKDTEPATTAEQTTLTNIVEKEAKGEELTQEEEDLKAEKPKRYEKTKVIPQLLDEIAKTQDEINASDEMISSVQGEMPYIYDLETNAAVGDNNLPATKNQTESKTTEDNKFSGVNPVSLLGKSFGTDSVQGNGDGLLSKALFNTLFNQPYSALRQGLQDKISFTVSKTEQKEGEVTITHGQDSKIPAFPNLRRQKFSHEIQIFYDGIQVGILTLGNSINYVTQDGKSVPLSQITQEQYQDATLRTKLKRGEATRGVSNNPSTYGEFMELVKGYEAASAGIIEEFNNGKTDFNSDDINKYFDEVGAWFGARDEVATADESTKIADFQYSPDGAMIVKVPFMNGRRSTDPSTFTFVTKNGVVGYNALNAEAKKLFAARLTFQQNKPYYVVMPKPDGSFDPNSSFIIARPAALRAASEEEVMNAIKASKAQGESVLDNLYINVTSGERNKGIRIVLNKNNKGEINLHFQDRNNNSHRTTVTLRESEVKNIKTLNDLVDAINSKTSVLDEYSTILEPSDIQQSDFDSKNLDYAYMADNLTASVTPQVFKDSFIHFKPKTGTITQTANSAQIEQQEQAPAPTVIGTPTPAAAEPVIESNSRITDIEKRRVEALDNYVKSIPEYIDQVEKLQRYEEPGSGYEDKIEFQRKNVQRWYDELIGKIPGGKGLLIDTINQKYDAELAAFEPNTASMPLMITSLMRQLLTYDLGYNKADIDKMTPQEATDIINNNTPKPKPLPLQLTNEMRDKLYLLNYEKKDVDSMSVADAQEVIDNNEDKVFPSSEENRLFDISRTISTLAQQLNNTSDENQKMALQEKIEDLQEELSNSEIGNEAMFIENNINEIIEQLKSQDRLKEEC